MSRAMTQMGLIDSALWDVNSDDNCSFYEGVRAIYDVIHPDITAPMNEEDFSYHLIKSPSKTRFLPRDKMPLKRKHSSSSVNFDTAKNQ